MKFTEDVRRQLIRSYLLIFYALAFWKWVDGGWLYQYEPFAFQTRIDGLTWLFMQTRLHQYFIEHPGGYLFLDLLFYAMPGLYYLVYVKSRRLIPIAGFLMLLVNWLYVQLYTLYPTNSIEGHIAWLLMPLLFMMGNLNSFWLVMRGLRYYFMFFFASAGIWKIYSGGVFFKDQMSNLLMYQHKNLLVSSPDHWSSRFLYTLIRNPSLSYLLYLFATLTELSFLVGFFTRKFDRVLILIFLVFLFFDQFIMKIGYFEVLPLLLPVYYSRYSDEPEPA
jgi:hypothetical protein